MNRYYRLACLLIALAAWTHFVIADDDVIDFSDQMTPVCEVVGLTAEPPPGWFNVPIESQDEAVTGCQMMRTGEQDELLGIIRLLSVRLPEMESEDAPLWYDVLISIEYQMVANMGYAPGEVLWSRPEVPITGTGFENARAVGLAASIDGSDVPQEVHFLVFEGEQQKYIMTLLTPAESVDGGADYQRNISDFGILIRSLKQMSGPVTDP